MENYAIEVLERSKQDVQERAQREMAEIDAAIARLRIRDAQESGHHNGKLKVAAGQFKGLRISNALQAYLNLTGKLSAQLNDVERDLLIAGVDLGKADRRKRNLKIVITNNPKLFIYNDNLDTVELVPASKRLPGKAG